MSDSRRERLLDIQKREQLKGMLVNKFKIKYAQKDANLNNYIDNEVTKFLKNDRLTEDNLKKLDDKISKETDLRLKKQDILDDRKSQRSRPGTTASQKQGLDNLETKSVRSVASSRMSGASRISKQSQKPG